MLISKEKCRLSQMVGQNFCLEKTLLLSCLNIFSSSGIFCSQMILKLVPNTNSWPFPIFTIGCLPFDKLSLPLTTEHIFDIPKPD